MNGIPHHINENFMEHPDFAIRMIEKVAIHSFEENCKRVEEMLNIQLKFLNYIPDSNQAVGYRTMEFYKDQLGTVYSLLPVLLATDVQRLFKMVVPYAYEYPIGLHYTQDSLVQSVPGVVTTDHINMIPYLLDYAIERFIHKGVVLALLPQYASNNADYDLYENEYLKKSLMDALKKTSNNQEIDISLTDIIFRYQNIINASLQGLEVNFKVDLNEFRELQGDVIRISDFMFSNSVKESESVAIIDDKNLLKVSKPQFSATERQKLYQEKLEKERFNELTSDNDIRSYTI